MTNFGTAIAIAIATFFAMKSREKRDDNSGILTTGGNGGTGDLGSGLTIVKATQVITVRGVSYIVMAVGTSKDGTFSDEGYFIPNGTRLAENKTWIIFRALNLKEANIAFAENYPNATLLELTELGPTSDPLTAAKLGIAFYPGAIDYWYQAVFRP